MKKVLKIIGIVGLSIIGFYTLFLIEESIRLSMDTNNKPFIIIKETSIDKSIDEVLYYESIGFKLINKYVNTQEETGSIESTLVGQEFWLFDAFMLWGWIS